MAVMRPSLAAGLVVVGLSASAVLQTNSDSEAEKAAILEQMRGKTSDAGSSEEGSASVPASAPTPSPSAANVSAKGGRVKILMQGPLHFDSKDDTLTTLLFVWNSGGETEKVSFGVSLRDPNEEHRTATVVSPKEALVKSQDLLPVPLKLKFVDKQGWDAAACAPFADTKGPFLITIPGSSRCYPLVGLLVISNRQVGPRGVPATGNRSRTNGPETNSIGVLLPTPRSEGIQSQILLRSFVVAAICVAIAMLLAAMARRYPWDPVLGSPSWDFKKSWSANATLFLGLLTALLGFGGLPAQTTILARNSYLILSILAIAMIGMGPLIYASIQRNVAGDSRTKRGGILLTAYLAGLVVLGAAYMQFGLVWLIFAELVRAGVITSSTNELISLGLSVIAIVLFVYGVVSLRWLAIDSDPKKSLSSSVTEIAASQAYAAAPPAEPTWNLL